MSRYVDATEEVYNVFYDVVEESFPGYIPIMFKIVMDTKKRISKGKLVMASIELLNDKTRFLTTSDDVPEGYDFLLILDDVVWKYASDKDRRRIISHELNHVFVDEKGKYKIVGHDIEDFIEEIKKNADDPEWAKNLTLVAMAAYDQKDE